MVDSKKLKNHRGLSAISRLQSILSLTRALSSIQGTIAN